MRELLKLNYQIMVWMAISVMVSILYVSGVSKQWIQQDEHAWVRRGVIVFQEYDSLHFSRAFWDSYISYDQPKFGEYLFGAITTGFYRTDWKTLLEQTHFTYPYSPTTDDYYSRGVWWMDYVGVSNPLRHLPSVYHEAYKLIVIDRYMSVVSGLLALIFLYLIGKKIFGFWIGCIAYVLLSQHPVFYAHTLHAIADILYVCIENVVVLLMFMYASEFPTVSVYSPIGIGIFIGLLVSTKLNGIMMLSFYMLIWALSYTHQYAKAKEYPPSRGYPFVHLLIIIMCTVSVFYILNPYVWDNPIDKVLRMYSWRWSETIGLTKVFPQVAVMSLMKRPYALLNALFLPSGCCQGVRVIPYFDLILFSIGILWCVYWGIIKQHRMIALLLVWIIFLFTTMIVYLPLIFDRYLLPIIPYVIVIESVGIFVVISWSISFLRKRLVPLVSG